ncbi:GPP34 family phosphoprotein [Ornithinimicrobium sp. Y1847]|uniref:GPP34 family phosphoprotein n=1 Tax=unclassified Ornithinimicrobium TaxID=2615080 RepID=UPI003B66CFE8
MLLGEELILLLLDDEKGTWLLPKRAVRRSVRVALVVELLARRTVSFDDDGNLVQGLSGTTDGDPVLDRVAKEIVDGSLVTAMEPGSRELPQLLSRLRSKGVLRRGHLLRRRHLPRDHHPEAAVRARLAEALGVRMRPDRHTALLVAMVYEMDLLGRLFPERDSLEMASRAATITTQLRTDAHYFPTTLEQDAKAGEGSAIGLGLADGAGDVLSGIGDALELLELVGNMIKLASLPIRAVGKILEDLP